MKRIIDNVYLYRPQHNDDPNQIYNITFEDGKITAIKEGRVKDDADQILDGHGKTLTASFNDSHMHLLRFGLMKEELDLRKVVTWQEMKYEIEQGINERILNENDWIVGRGMKDNNFKDINHLITADELDEVDVDKPLFVLHDSGHECVVNHKALDILKEEKELSDKHEAFIERDENGEMTGRFKDTAVHFIKFIFRKKSDREIREAVRSAVPHLLKKGITSVQTDDLNYAGSYQRLWDAYNELEKKGELPIKVYLHHYVFNRQGLEDFLNNFDKRSGEGSEHVRIGAVKIFLDGTQRLHTAAVREPYNDMPGTTGELIYTQEELNELVRLADQNKMQVTMHAIGDRTIDEGITAIRDNGSPEMRHRLIHVQTLAPDLLEKLQKSDICVEIQPGSVMKEYNKYKEWFGEERAPYCNMANSISEYGITFTASSDTPVDPLDPHNNIFAAVNRTDREGNPHGGWMPQEKMPVDTAYKAYTETPAYIEFLEEKKGKIEKGFDADFILLSDHPKKISKEKLKDITVTETWVDGERVYMN
ncbi:MAG TPA: amidohydrolase [Balneolales bacterium]|nr:amidohydrolase [Balneolales bacterium]